MNMSISDQSRSSLPTESFNRRESYLVQQVENHCNEFIREFPAYNFRNWKEYYMAWAELDGKHPNEKSCFRDPHIMPYGNLPWTIKYHQDSLKNLKRNEKNIKKIVECVLRLSYGNFQKEIVENEFLRIMVQIEKNLWVTAVAAFTVIHLENALVQGNLLVMSVGNKLIPDDEMMNNLSKTRNKFLKVEDFESLIETTIEGFAFLNESPRTV